MMPKFPLFALVESYFSVTSEPGVAALTVFSVTAHGTIPEPPPNENLPAAAIPPTARELMPTIFMNAKLCDLLITTRTVGVVEPPLIVTVMSLLLIAFFDAHLCAADWSAV